MLYDYFNNLVLSFVEKNYISDNEERIYKTGSRDDEICGNGLVVANPFLLHGNSNGISMK